LKKVFGTVAFGILCIFSGAQNLVPNGSFEAFTSCPAALSQTTLAAPWYNPTLDSADYFNACSASPLAGVPVNANGFQSAHGGSGYAGVSCFGVPPGNRRAYLQVRLTDSLVAQKSYCVSFFVNLADTSGFAITELGAYLSSTAVTTLNQLALPVVPQISSAAHVYLRDTLNWIQISGTYIALGGEKFITIGNFNDDPGTDTLRFTTRSQVSYYYIDDVTVNSCESVPLGCSLTVPNVFTPNNDKVNDVFKIATTNIDYLNCRIYDRWGGKVYEMVTDYDSWDGRNSTGLNCADGVYFYILKATGADGKDYSKTGFIQLIR
jgi:gliding motility-associated-like protein